MRVIIAGGRDFNNYKYLVEKIDLTFTIMLCSTVDLILSGKALGADSLGERYAKDHGIAIDPYPATWRVNGVFDPTAGFIRNEEMARNADVLIVFWDGLSTGTKDMIDRANKHGLEVYIYYYGISQEINPFN